MGQDPPLKWDEADDPAWLAEVNSWPWKPIGDGAWAKSGPCHYCRHSMTAKAGVEGVIALGPEAANIDLMVLEVTSHSVV